MIELRLLKNYVFALAMVISSIASVVLMGSLFLLPIFLQNISGLSAIQTGLVLLPQALTTAVMMPIAGMLFDKFGARWIAIIGLLITSLSFILSSVIDMGTPHSTISFWLIIRAIGIGLMMMPVQTVAMNTIPIHKVGQGTAITNTIRQVAASFGIAWLTLLLSNRQIYHAAVDAQSMNKFSSVSQSSFQHMQAMFLAHGQSLQQAKLSAMGVVMKQVQLGAMVQAIDDVFWVMSLISLAAVVFAFFLKGSKRRKAGKQQNAPHVMAE